MLGTFLRWIAVIVVVASGAAGYWFWRDYQRRSMLPDGIVSGNGRIESIQVDVAAKYAGRISRIFAREGDLVKTGQVLAKMDTEEMEAELAKDKAKVAEAEEAENQVKAEIVQRESELKYQNQLYDRNRALLSRNVISREEMEQTQTKRDVAVAALDATKAKLQTSRRSIEAAAAEVKRIQTQIVDSTLTSPVEGRVLYKLAEEREVLAAGGKVLTLINLGDIYMEIFLPSRQAARVEIGADSRIVIDAAPQYAARAKVSFVSPEAQFTPKQVETQSERDKLMFRIKLQVPQELVLPYIERVKTGVRGIGYVKIDEATPWPEKLEHRFPLPEPAKPVQAEPSPTAPKLDESPTPKAGSTTTAPSSELLGFSADFPWSAASHQDRPGRAYLLPLREKVAEGRMRGGRLRDSSNASAIEYPSSAAARHLLPQGEKGAWPRPVCKPASIRARVDFRPHQLPVGEVSVT